MRTVAVSDEVSVAVEMQGSALNRPSTIRSGDLVVDLDSRVVLVDDKPVRLTGKEYSVLELLSLGQGTTANPTSRPFGAAAIDCATQFSCRPRHWWWARRISVTVIRLAAELLEERSVAAVIAIRPRRHDATLIEPLMTVAGSCAMTEATLAL